MVGIPRPSCERAPLPVRPRRSEPTGLEDVPVAGPTPEHPGGGIAIEGEAVVMIRRITVSIAAGAIAFLGLIGTSTPAHASCTVIAEELGCTESVACRIASKVRPTNCIQ
jgi:hypothetical protein